MIPSGFRLRETIAVPFALVAIATALTFLARDVAEHTLFVFFVAAVALSTWRGRWQAGLVAGLLSVFVVDFAFTEPRGALKLATAAAAVRMFSFVVVAACVGTLTEALCRARENAEALARDAEDARAIAERASAAKSEFLSTMSHEIRTPINALIGYADLLDTELAGPITGTQRDYLTRQRAAARHLLSLVNDVLDVAKAEAGRLSVDSSSEMLSSTVDDSVSLVIPQARLKGVTVRVETGDPAIQYSGDRNRVHQILVNLLANAVRFTPSGGSVTISTGVATAGARASVNVPGPVAWVRVSDTGVGIAPEDQARIFEPFEQVEMRLARTKGGTGLGLAISRRLALLMGGELTVESAVARGSAFTLWLQCPSNRSPLGAAMLPPDRFSSTASNPSPG